MYVPCTRHIPCWHPACAWVTTHLVWSLITKCTIEDVTALIAVSSVTIEGYTAWVGWVNSIIGIARLQCTLEILIDIEWYHTCIITQTSTLEGIALTFDARQLHTTKEVHDMLLGKGVAIVSRCTNVVIAHAVVALMIQTTVWQHGHWQHVRVIWVFIKILVSIADNSVWHRTISQCLIGFILHKMLLCWSHILECTQDWQLQTLDRLVLQFQLETSIEGVEVDIVVIQLVEDVEWCIIRYVGCWWVKYTWGVACVGIRVDIEVTLHLTTYYVNVLTKCSRCTLLTISRTTNEVQRQLIWQVLCEIHIERITVYVALLIPSRV